MTKAEQLEALRASCENCTACPLGKTRTNLVFGVGSAEASLVFVGEAPGEKEDLSGVPFVGPAGQLFDRYLDVIDLPRESVYICNILKCRPPRNRDPEETESSACLSHLREQIRIIRPGMIVCLGRIAAMQLIKPDFRITREHGTFFEKNGVKMCAVYHPSALLHDPAKRADMLRDMMAVKAVYDTLPKAEK